MHKCGLCCSPVSIHPSGCHIGGLYPHSWTAGDIVKLLIQPSSRIILVFWPLVPIPNSKGNLSAGVIKYRGREWENLRFLTDIAVYLGNGASKAHDYCWMLMGSCRWWIDVCSDDLEWPQTWVSRSLYTYKSNISKPVHVLSIYQSKKSRLGRRKCREARDTTRAPNNVN